VHILQSLALLAICCLATPTSSQLLPHVCKDDSHSILSYHVHVVFNGTDVPASTQAIRMFHTFETAVSAYMNITYVPTCPFSHANAAPQYSSICVFGGFDASMESFPFEGSGVFTGSNFAYFIPRNPHLFMWATEWFRRSLTSYIFHVNTGCEDMDHTAWAISSEGYQWPVVRRDHLYCCHEGGTGCYCDIVQYSSMHGCLGVELSPNTSTATVQLSPNISTATVRFNLPCKTAQFIGGGTWRETYPSYQHSPSGLASPSALVEWFGMQWHNTGLCLATKAAQCAFGTPLVVRGCSEVGADAGLAIEDAQKATTFLQPSFLGTGVGETSLVSVGSLRVPICGEDICVGDDGEGAPILINCNNATAAQLLRRRLLG